MRFEGSMNVDINDITTNLIPFPSLKFLISSMAPLYVSTDVRNAVTKADALFTQLYARDALLTGSDPLRGKYMASAIIARGDGIALSDVRRNIEKWKGAMKFVDWNPEAWKVGLCSIPPPNQVCLFLV